METNVGTQLKMRIRMFRVQKISSLAMQEQAKFV